MKSPSDPVARTVAGKKARQRRSFAAVRGAVTRVCAAAGALVVPPKALAQSGADNANRPPINLIEQQRTIDERLTREREQALPMQSLLDWQWGGWVDYYIFHFQDGIQSQRVQQRPGLALWSRLTIDQGAHQLFARARLNFSYFNPGDEYDRQQDWIGPNFDRAFYDVDLLKALHLGPTESPVALGARIGRQDVQFGTGYVLDAPLDAVRASAKAYDVRVTALVARAIGSYPNMDRSESVDSHSARRLLGIQLGYEGFDHHQPFAYALWNDDYVDERPQDPLQAYAYDTRYFGFGSRGQFVHNFNYWTEWVYESGRSYGDGNYIRRDEVDAWAFDVGIEYLWDASCRPRVTAEYMFASGDSDRVFSPTNAAGGNRGDREDTSFNGLGYRDTGIAASLGNSNLHVWRLGGSVTPLPQIEMLRDMELGTNWFLYHKHHRRGAVTDSTADMFEGYLGWEMDFFANWRISSDLSWTIRWGMFFPGDAYQQRDERSFLFTGLTWSF